MTDIFRLNKNKHTCMSISIYFNCFIASPRAARDYVLHFSVEWERKSHYNANFYLVTVITKTQTRARELCGACLVNFDNYFILRDKSIVINFLVHRFSSSERTKNERNRERTTTMMMTILLEFIVKSSLVPE
jgi:hypothetical protein